jgi:peptidoglycan hydrolase CwlO-like protein
MSVFSADGRLRMTIKNNWKFLVIVVAVCATLFYVFDFTSLQSWVLSYLFVSTFSSTEKPEEKELKNLAKRVPIVILLGLALLTEYDNKRYANLKSHIDNVESMVDDTNNKLDDLDSRVDDLERKVSDIESEM